MNILGIGPILVIVGITTSVLVVAVEKLAGLDLKMPAPWREILVMLGFVLGLVGVYFWFSSALRIKRGFPAHRLMTDGVYRYSRNPMYAGFIIFLVPAIAFVFNKPLLLSASITMFIAFKRRISKEEAFLAEKFGEDYRQYAAKVPQLIPFVKTKRS